MSEEKGKRFNKGKLRYRNFPLWLMKPLAEVGHYGETKYETFNFLKGMSVQDCIDCMYRHVEKADDPNQSDIDDESGCHHLAHVAWNALVALYFIKTRPDLDDRYKSKVLNERKDSANHDRAVVAEMLKKEDLDRIAMDHIKKTVQDLQRTKNEQMAAAQATSVDTEVSIEAK